MAQTNTRTLTLGLLLALTAYTCWAFLSPITRRLLEDAGPMWLNAIRFAIATALLAPFVGRAGWASAWRLMRDRRLLAANGMANVSLAAFTAALITLDAAPATLLFYTAPLWTALLAWWMLRERPGPGFAIAGALLLVGGYLGLYGWAGPDGIAATGFLLALGSGVGWALYTVLLRSRAPDVPFKGLIGMSFLVGTLFFAVAAPIVEGAPPTLDAAAWSWMALYVLVPTLGSFVAFNAATRLVAAAEVNLMVGAELVGASALAWIMLGEALGPIQVVGLGIVVVAVTWHAWYEARGAAKATLVA